MATALAALLAGCGPDPVELGDPPARPGERAACAALVEQLPQQLIGLARRDQGTRYAVAWGDPPVVLRCGVAPAAGFDELSSCHVVNDVAWYIPDEQVTGEATDVLMTTVGRRPRVEVSLPADYFPPAAAMAQLAQPLREGTRLVDECH